MSRRVVSRNALALLLVLLGTPLVLAAPPARAATPRTCPSAPSGVLRTAPGSGKTVALTFDDGPGRSTAQVIDILQRAHITATFFNLGVHEQEHPELVRRERDAGFALGNHTWDHIDLPSLSAAQQASEMDRERAVDSSITGMYPCLFRPPGGDRNATTLRLAQRRRMQVWTWSVDPEDWKAVGSAAPRWINRITSRAEDASQTHPVVLLHNQVGGNPATVAALPNIINFYKSRGYRFVNLFDSTHRPAVTRAARATSTSARSATPRPSATGTTRTRVAALDNTETPVIVRPRANSAATLPSGELDGLGGLVLIGCGAWLLVALVRRARKEDGGAGDGNRTRTISLED